MTESDIAILSKQKEDCAKFINIVNGSNGVLQQLSNIKDKILYARTEIQQVYTSSNSTMYCNNLSNVNNTIWALMGEIAAAKELINERYITLSSTIENATIEDPNNS